MVSPQWSTCFKALMDPEVTELEVNSKDSFFVKRKGSREKLSDVFFEKNDDYVESIKSSLIPIVHSSMQYDPENFLYEGQLILKSQNGNIMARCHIVLPPASNSPQITIAKKSTSLLSIEDIAKSGSMTREMLAFLKASIRANLTIVFSGGTGSGKTTMLEALTKIFRSDERIGVAEDIPELQLIQKNVMYIHSTPVRPNMENYGADLTWLVKQFNRARVDKIIIGETRGAEFAEFLVAANSGMEGSLTTIHANNPVQCLHKMTNFAIRGMPGVPQKSINTDLANSIDLIVQLNLINQRGYRVTDIQEITNTVSDRPDAAITTQSLYKYDSESDEWGKNILMTDSLRKRFIDNGVNISEFIRNPNTKSKAYNANMHNINVFEKNNQGRLPRIGNTSEKGQTRKIGPVI